MTLRLFNSLTRTKEEFQPLDARNVRMYVCGPTVYDYAHIGNARPAIVFDVLYRLLRHLYGEKHVTYVRNITDVDDKINARAAERDISIRDLTEETYKHFKEDVKALACLDPTHEPRATENIEQMIVLVQRLLDQRYAYVARGGEGREVLFDVLSMPDYGALSRRNLDEQIAGARVAVEDHKRNPEDFVLWKESDASEPGWDATFEISDENREELGLNSTTLTIHGRPGWHLECSAMSERYLWTEIEGRLSGKARAHPHQFDIHGGGIDLIFPHHENEIAQTRCAFGTEGMAQIWMHNGFLQVEGQKMSKSLGNFVTIHELLNTQNFGGRIWLGGSLRLAMLRTHYRKPIDWTVNALESAESRFIEWADLEKDLLTRFGLTRAEVEEEWASPAFFSALMDDLNTPLALSVLYGQGENSEHDAGAGRAFLAGISLLGLEGWSLQDQQTSRCEALTPRVDPLIAARKAARATKNWGEADRIRDKLTAMGIVLKDNPDGTTVWEVKR
jgi:cysteinyl-tRNA synthetase